MADVEFTDNRIKIKNAIKSVAIAALEEGAGEIESQTKRNTRVADSNGGKTKNSWEHKVIDSELTAHIGSNYENAIWEEFGTGEYALEGKGRNGYWVFVKGSSGSAKNTGKTYTLEEAKKLMAILRSKGLEAYYTKGKKPSRALWKAYILKKSKIISMIQNRFKGLQ